jgi:Na+/proline symporter
MTRDEERVMSESVVLKLSEAQTAAMNLFVKRCEYAMLTVVFACFAAIALVVAANPGSPDIASALLALVVAICVYPLVLLVIIWLRAGLKWHLLNAHAKWLGISGGLLAITLAFMDSFTALLQGTPRSGFSGNSAFLLLIVVIVLFVPAFRSSTQSRAERERVHFADHWLKLGSLPFWRVFLLLIPHERA